MTYSILIADDDPEIRDVLKLYMESAGYRVLEAEDGVQALELLTKETVHLVLLDVMMPKMDGYSVLRNLRKNSNVPVLILSAKDEDTEKILGLNLGADDYIAKPFNPLEVMARVSSGLRRNYEMKPCSTSESADVEIRGLRLNAEEKVIYKNDHPLELSATEYRILSYMMEHAGHTLSKEQIYEQGWGDSFVSDNSIMVCMSKLRLKLSDDPGEYIKTIRGLGYRMEKM